MCDESFWFQVLDPEFAEQNELTGLGPLPLLTSLRTSLVKPSKRDEDGSNIVLESVLVQDCSFKAFGIESLLGNEMISGYFRCRRLDLRSVYLLLFCHSFSFPFLFVRCKNDCTYSHCCSLFMSQSSVFLRFFLLVLISQFFVVRFRIRKKNHLYLCTFDI